MTTKNIITPIYVNGKPVGRVQGNVFYKTIRNNHMLKNPPAIASNITVLQDAIEAGAELAIIKNTESKTTYKASMDTILSKGVKMNRGHGEQLFLILKYWDTKGKDKLVKDTKPEPVQYAMFGGAR